MSQSQGGFALSAPCRECQGKGFKIDDPCPDCKGTGRRERVQRIRVPAGVADGQRLRVRGRGVPGERGGPNGDLEVTVLEDGCAAPTPAMHAEAIAALKPVARIATIASVLAEVKAL